MDGWMDAGSGIAGLAVGWIWDGIEEAWRSREMLNYPLTRELSGIRSNTYNNSLQIIHLIGHVIEKFHSNLHASVQLGIFISQTHSFAPLTWKKV